MNRNYYFESKFKRLSICTILLIIVGGWLWYIFWTSSISHKTVLQKSGPEWETYLSFSAFIGSASLIFAFYVRNFNKEINYLFKAFFSGFCLGLVTIFNCYDVYVYLFSENIIGYESEYEVVFPGPSRGKYGRCEAGVWIKDQNTNRWKLLCTNKEYLRSHLKQGMTKVWVSARENKIGTYIVNYEFIYK